MSPESELGTLRTISVPYAKPGMILARAAVTDTGRIIFTTGTVLNQGKIKILKNTYIRYIHVWDSGVWSLPSDAYKSDAEAPDPAAGAIQAVGGLLASVQDLNNVLIREKKIGLDTLKNMASEIFGRVQKEPVFQIFLEVDRSANYLFSHMVNVAVVGVTVSRSMGLSSKEIWDVFVSGLLMDIGMLQVREDLWHSEKVLTDVQRKEVERHTEFGFKAVMRARGIDEKWARPALEHHERVDRSGYPDGKDGASLSPVTRILSVCDVYEALVHNRLWRKAVMPDEAVKDLLGKTKQLDRDVIAHLARSIGVYPVGTRVKLSSGAEAEVVAVNPTDLLRPVVETLMGNAAARVDLSQTPELSVVSIVAPPQKR